jgi:glycosyltransferase involved in cell wall biosynthesis
MTRVLLMPSRYESYGRTAIEAAASGIPTIAHPTPGLREALGAAGIYANRDNPDDWVTAIRALTSDPVAYSRRSRQVQKRFAASQVTSAGEIDRLIARIEHP